MDTLMDTKKYLSAITKRCSRRKYIDKPMEDVQIERLNGLIQKYNETSCLRIQLRLGEGAELFDGFKKSYGFFSGVQSYLAMVGKKDDPHRKEKVGRFGELLILDATDMGLSTCWVGGTYDAKIAQKLAYEDEVLECVISIGYSDEKHSLRERLIEGLVHRKDSIKYSVGDKDDTIADWFFEGMSAVYLVPSALNQKPFHFEYSAGNVTARATKDTPYAMIDLGIAKLHFEIGSGGGKWEYGSPGTFQYFSQ